MMFLLGVSCVTNFNALHDTAVPDIEYFANTVIQLQTIKSALTSHFWYTIMPAPLKDMMTCRRLFDVFHLTVAVREANLVYCLSLHCIPPLVTLTNRN
jgi:hypothetical protein